MSKYSCYQKKEKKGKKVFKKKCRRRYQSFTEEEKQTKSENMVVNNIRISQKLKNKD